MAAGKIEAPYLQLVMQRLWQEEGIPEQSLILHTDTFQSLSGAKGIIQEYVDRCMAKLLQSQREAIGACSMCCSSPHSPRGFQSWWSMPTLTARIGSRSFWRTRFSISL